MTALDSDTILCPECGWTGDRSALDEAAGTRSCPICDQDIEVVD